MEAYKSYCPDCERTYYWQGFKTGIGKTQQQLNEMKNKRTICKHCYSTNLKTILDHDSEAGKQQDEASSLIMDMLFGKRQI